MILSFLFLCVSTTYACNNDSDSIKKLQLKDIQVLTFQKNGLIITGKYRNFKQLKCTSGCSNEIFVQSIECTNLGSFEQVHEIKWNCQAKLPPHLKLTNTYITCDSFDKMNPYNPYIIAGSCKLEYSLVETPVIPYMNKYN